MKKTFIFVLIVFLISSCRKTEDLTSNMLKLYGDALEDIGYSVTDAGDGLIIAGQITEVNRGGINYINTAKSKKRMGLVKTGYDGNVIWQKSFGDYHSAFGEKAIVLEDGSVVCAGTIVVDSVTLLKNIFLIKTDNQGNLITQKIFSEPGNANRYATDIIRTPDGFLVLSVTDAFRAPDEVSAGNPAGKYDIMILKTDNDLDIAFAPKSFGYPGNDVGVAIKQDITGEYIVVATTDRSEPGSAQGGDNILILGVNSRGEVIKNNIIGTSAEENASDIEVQSDGYLIVSTVGADGQDQYGYVWKLSQDIFEPPVYQNKIEIQSLSGTVSYKINAISKYKKTSYVMAGQSGIGTSARMLIFLTDSEGNLLDENVVYNGGTGSQSVNDVISDEGGNIYAVGKNSYESNSMISLLKFRF